MMISRQATDEVAHAFPVRDHVGSTRLVANTIRSNWCKTMENSFINVDIQ